MDTEFKDVKYMTFKVDPFKLVDENEVGRYTEIDSSKNIFKCKKCNSDFKVVRLLYKHIYYQCEVIKTDWIDNFFKKYKHTEERASKLEVENCRLRQKLENIALNEDLLKEIKKLKEELYNAYRANDDLETKIKNTISVYEHNICLLHKAKDDMCRKFLNEIEILNAQRKVIEVKNATLELDNTSEILTNLNKALYNRGDLKLKILKPINYEWVNEYFKNKKIDFYIRGLDELVKGLIKGPLKKMLSSTKNNNILKWKDEDDGLINDKGGLILSRKIIDILVSYLGEYYRDITNKINELIDKCETTPGILHMYELFKSFKNNDFEEIYKTFGGYLIKYSSDEF